MKPFFIVNLLVLGHNIRHSVGLYEIYFNLTSNLVDLQATCADEKLKNAIYKVPDIFNLEDDLGGRRY